MRSRAHDAAHHMRKVGFGNRGERHCASGFLVRRVTMATRRAAYLMPFSLMPLLGGVGKAVSVQLPPLTLMPPLGVPVPWGLGLQSMPITDVAFGDDAGDT
jgi:hypothetical protein